MIRRFLLSLALLVVPLWAHGDWAADRDGSAGYVTVTTLATAVDEAVPFCVVYLSDMPADFWTAMDTASDTDGKTIRVSTSDGTTQLACVPIGVNTSTDTGCLIFLGTGMSASVDVDYRIYVGNASLSMPTASGGMGREAVFASYAGVYIPAMFSGEDLTAGNRDLTTNHGTTASGMEGITAATYNGTSQYDYYSGTQAVTNWPITLECVAYSTTNASTRAAFALSNTASANNDLVDIRFAGATTGDPIKFTPLGATGSVGDADSTSGYTTNSWHYAVGTRDSNNAPGDSYAYIDGGSQGTNAANTQTPSAFNRVCVGGRISSSINYFNGGVAVALLSSSVRNTNYVSTMADNWAGTMYSTGAWTANDSSCNSGSTGWVLFQTIEQSTSAAADWSNTSNAIVDDSNKASVSLDPGGVYESEYLNFTNPAYGTTIPTGADSYTVSVRIKHEGQTTSGRDIVDLTVQFIDDTGTRVGDNVADGSTRWPSTPATVDYTLTGLTLDGSEFTSAAGLSVRATAVDSAISATAAVYVAWIKIDWTCGDDAAAKARGFFALTE